MNIAMRSMWGGVVNKFNKDDTTVYNAYIDNSGSWLLANDSRSIKIPCKSNTQYTLSINVPNNQVFRIYKTDNEDALPNSEGTTRLTEVLRATTTQQYTFTTSAQTKALIFQGGASYLTDWLNSLMLVEGSTAPSTYHPYYEWVI